MADRTSTTEVINLIAEFASDPSRTISIPNPISFDPTVTEGIETSTLGEYIVNVETLVKNNNLLIGDKNSSAFVRFANPVSRITTTNTILDLYFSSIIDSYDDGDLELYGAHNYLEEVDIDNIPMIILQLFVENPESISPPNNYTNLSYWYVPNYDDNNLCTIAEYDDIFSSYVNSTLTSDYGLQIISQEGVVSTYSLEGVAVNYESGTDSSGDYYEHNFISLSQSVLPVGCIFRFYSV